VDIENGLVSFDLNIGMNKHYYELFSYLIKSKSPIFRDHALHGIKLPYSALNNKYKYIINEHYTNNVKGITLTKFLKLITPYDFIFPYHQNIKFNFNKNKFNNIKLQNVITLLEYAFKSISCLISKPVFIETKDKLIINIFYFFVYETENHKRNFFNNKYNLFSSHIKRSDATSFFTLAPTKTSARIATSLNGIPIPPKDYSKYKKIKSKVFSYKDLFKKENISKFNDLTTILSRIFKKSVTIDLIPLRQPFYDDNILVKAIQILTKKMSVLKLFNLIYRNTILYSNVKAKYNYRYAVTRSFLSGIKIRIGGRLMTQRVIPKLSTRILQRGAIAKSKVSFVD
jgi:hypothetical protein